MNQQRTMNKGNKSITKPGWSQKSGTIREREQRYETERNRVIRMAMDRNPNPAARGVRHA